MPQSAQPQTQQPSAAPQAPDVAQQLPREAAGSAAAQRQAASMSAVTQTRAQEQQQSAAAAMDDWVQVWPAFFAFWGAYAALRVIHEQLVVAQLSARFHAHALYRLVAALSVVFWSHHQQDPAGICTPTYENAERVVFLHHRCRGTWGCRGSRVRHRSRRRSSSRWAAQSPSRPRCASYSCRERLVTGFDYEAPCSYDVSLPCCLRTLDFTL